MRCISHTDIQFRQPLSETNIRIVLLALWVKCHGNMFMYDAYLDTTVWTGLNYVSSMSIIVTPLTVAHI